MSDKRELILCLHLVGAAHAAGVTMEAMRQGSRQSKIVKPRRVAMYSAYEKYGFSLNEIGREFNRDHSTVHHAVNRVRGHR